MRETPFPLVSVIVPTYNRAQVLPYLFKALAEQVYPADRMELIVVDNSSSDDSEAVFERWKAVFPFPAAFYRKDNKGPAVSRNYGAARARGEILAFTDSDCIPEKRWLRNAMRGFVNGAGLVCGPLVPVPREGDGLLVAQETPSLTDRGTYPTANFIVRRSIFEQAGGFDARYGVHPWGELVAGEDTDLAWRIKRSGVRVAFLPDVAVLHLATKISLKRLLLRPVIIQIFPALLTKIPELRRTYLWMRYFNSKVHFYFHLAWIGALTAAFTAQPLAFALAVPWTWHSLGHVLYPGVRYKGLRFGLAGFVIYLYFQIALPIVLAVASLRYRRLVL